MLIACEICHKNLMGNIEDSRHIEGKHEICCSVCFPALPYYLELKERCRKEELRSYAYHDAAEKIIGYHSEQLLDNKDKVEISKDIIKDFLALADYKGDVNKFIYHRHIELLVVADAASLFLTHKRDPRTNGKTTAEKLERLYESLESHRKYNYPNHNESFDFGPDVLIHKIKNER